MKCCQIPYPPHDDDSPETIIHYAGEILDVPKHDAVNTAIKRPFLLDSRGSGPPAAVSTGSGEAV